ncbi:MAG: hypothetical protein ACRDAQ_07755 [Cetobacterium sp.]
MAGIKGMKTGGFSTGRPISENPKNVQMRVTEEERELLQKIRKKVEMEEILKLLKEIY